MKKIFFAVNILILLSSCQPENAPWKIFKECATNACVTEGLAVKDAFLKDPKSLLSDFQKTYESGEDHVIGWLYMMRDSVLFNPKMGSTEERYAMQQAIVAAAQPFENDPKVGEMAKSILSEIGNLAIMSELENAPEEDPLEPLTGTYKYEYENDRGSGELEVSQLSLDKFQFKLSVFGPPPAHNHGFMEGVATLQDPQTATFSLNEYGGTCTLQFNFSEGVKIQTLQGEPSTCGFGNGVMADGKYEKTSAEQPFLSKNEAKAAALLSGEWQSTTDPKNIIKLFNGLYWEINGAEVMGIYPFNYFPKCPGDCNPIAKTPCLKLFGQDEVCFTIVKADGKVLSLSQIGGTGNTLVFTKIAENQHSPMVGIPLQGNWQSVDDKDFTVKIEGTDYTEMSKGKVIANQTFELSNPCAAPCGNPQEGVCMIVKGKLDATCYRVIRCDEKTLELSLVGGTGKSLIFNRL